MHEAASCLSKKRRKLAPKWGLSNQSQYFSADWATFPFSSFLLSFSPDPSFSFFISSVMDGILILCAGAEDTFELQSKLQRNEEKKDSRFWIAPSVWVERLEMGCRGPASPTEHSAILEPLNPLSHDFELHKVCRETDFRLYTCKNVLSGAIGYGSSLAAGWLVDLLSNIFWFDRSSRSAARNGTHIIQCVVLPSFPRFFPLFILLSRPFVAEWHQEWGRDNRTKNWSLPSKPFHLGTLL